VTSSRAYIAGVGTTGVLVGFALLMLTVVSALVAFRGWPGDTVVEGAGAVTVDQADRLIDIDPVRLASPSATAKSTAAAAGRGTGRRARTTGGRFEVQGVRTGESAGLAPGSAPVGGADQTAGGSGSASQGANPTTGLADGAQGATGAVEEVVTPAAGGLPDAGSGVTETLGGVKQKAEELGLR
jgi:hypothetical protein